MAQNRARRTVNEGQSAVDNDAFFDYNDRWMAQVDACATQRDGNPRPKSEGHSHDTFTDAMWAAYWSKVPEQTGGKDNLKWVWEGETKTGKFVTQP